MIRGAKLVPALVVLAVLVSTTVVPVAGQETAEVVLGEPEFDVYLPNNEVSPGEEATLEVSLTNSGTVFTGGPPDLTDRVTTARSMTVQLRAGDSPLDVKTRQVPIDPVPRGQTGTAAFQVTVPEDADPGTYEIPVELRYGYTRLIRYEPTSGGPNIIRTVELTTTRKTTLTVRVEEESRFRIVGHSSDALVGSDGDVKVQIENTGTEPATDANVRISSTSNELTFGSGSSFSTAFAGQWAPGEVKTVSYTAQFADSADPRNYTAKVVVEYDDPDGITGRSENRTFGIRPSGEQSFSVRNANASLRVGEEGSFTGEIVNEGPETARSAVVVFDPENPNLEVSENEYSLSTIEPGESESFAYDVDVTDAGGANRQLFSVTVRYKDADGDTRESDTLDTEVRVQPERDQFEVRSGNATVQVGQQSTVEIRVTNEGDERLTNVELKTFPNDPLSSDDDTGFIESLEPGETETVRIGISAGSGATPKTYPLSMDLQYEEPDGDTKVSDTYKAGITVTERESDGGFGLPLIGAAVAIVLVAIGVVIYRRR